MDWYKLGVMLMQASLFFSQMTGMDHWQVEECSTERHAYFSGEVCWVWLKDVRPSQAAIGLSEVEGKAGWWKEQSASDLLHYKWTRSVPAVRGPDSVGIQIFDHHHMVYSLWESEVAESDKWVYVNIYRDWKYESEKQFYFNMFSQGMIWLYDAKGLGPIDPVQLPRSLGEMSEDPFRSLAYLLRVNGVFYETIPFTEFYWANFMRDRLSAQYAEYQEYIEEDTEWCTNVRPYSRSCISHHKNKSAIRAMLEPAGALVCSDKEAHELPGYRRDFCSAHHGQRAPLEASPGPQRPDS
eukprot:TRINITY_DN5315_c0_g1_i1.p1 TRINITY_DN5315_c0_g1~~TRINITY_DN5315_c0_g1_i1.p1  ORF type:complete len:296 (+),score=87.01 TRINITY_DN5315_c0_g1_i1:284-1171(+)